ncbi:MAG TPA: DUF4157 domain-containing protein, partial [Stellaceae bacterium]|nr:DUF4157 domain-containing protein [Stellaceae bacterium]
PAVRRPPLVIGKVNDPLEREADHAADAAMAANGTAPALSAGAGLSRKCAACAEEEQETMGTMQAKPAGIVRAGEAAPGIVHSVLARPGRPLEPSTRGLLEPSFGRSFADIRIHDDAEAARSAAAVGAHAYTVGRNIVFGAGAYRPDTHDGRWLLAHEAAHTVQQAGGARRLSRACLPDAVCKPPEAKKGSQDDFVKKTNDTPAQKSKSDIRKAACGKVPPDAACTADGHGREATAAEAFLKSTSPGRLAAVLGVFVDMDMPAEWAGNTIACDGFVPPIPGGAGKRCTFIHDKMEKEAKQYNDGVNTIGGRDRRTWSESTIRLLTHETEHALFSAAAGPGTEVKDPAIACDFDANKSSLTELAAIISEFKPVHHKAQGLPEDKRAADLDWWFDFWIKSGGENIGGNVKALRCNCDCGPANAYINKMFVFATKDWNTYEKWIYNKTLSDPKWGLDWPVKEPASVPVDEIPDAAGSTDVQDLPSP